MLVSGGGGSVGLEVARSVLESGGDVVCLDSQDEPLAEPWGQSSTGISMLVNY